MGVYEHNQAALRSMRQRAVEHVEYDERKEQRMIVVVDHPQEEEPDPTGLRWLAGLFGVR